MPTVMMMVTANVINTLLSASQGLLYEILTTSPTIFNFYYPHLQTKCRLREVT